MTGQERRCPDDGRCWHECAPTECFRVRSCAPLSGYGETWTVDDVATFGGPPSKPCIEDVIVGLP